MTTIACVNGEMVADTLATDDYGLPECVNKLHMVDVSDCDGVVIGFSGSRHIGFDYVDWFTEKSSVYTDQKFIDIYNHFAYPNYNGDGVLNFIMMDCAGNIYKMGGNRIMKVTAYDFFAIGSGRDYALASMSYGHSATEAVICASKFDNSTGGMVDVITVKDLRKFIR